MQFLFWYRGIVDARSKIPFLLSRIMYKETGKAHIMDSKTYRYGVEGVRSSKGLMLGGVLLALFFLVGALCLGGCTPAEVPEEELPVVEEKPPSYEGIYLEIEKTALMNKANNYRLLGSWSDEDEGALGDEAGPIAELSAQDGSSSSESSAYSDTNVQVKGVDEGDFVKTDGTYIFKASGTEVAIYEALGKDTEEVSRIDLGATIPDLMDESDPYVWIQGLFVQEEKLMVIYGHDLDIKGLSGIEEEYAYKIHPGLYRQASSVAFYDISNPEDPRYVSTSGQDGYLLESRMQDGVLYLVSNHTVYQSEIDPDSPSTFVPLKYAEGKAKLAEAADIYIIPEFQSLSYTVVSSYDVETGRVLANKSILGSTGTFYMSYENLYLAQSEYRQVAGDSYQDGSFTVTQYTDSYDTTLTKMNLNSGLIEFAGSTSLEGALLNQFSMDEFEGNLRLVTTVDTSTYRAIADEKGSITDYNSFEYFPSTNNLIVLDSELEQIGAITGLAEDERVYSVRFDGAVGYFVTFRQIDPLFTVDLSDPFEPEIKSALEIPGFSQYLHPYSEGRLLGLGKSADENTGQAGNMKLSMFDTSDPYAVTEKHMLILDSYYSEALYDHKAILVDEKQNIIAFPTDEAYLVYGYSDTEGFTLRAKLSTSDDSYYYSPRRAMFIGKYFYTIAEDKIGVYSLEDFSLITKLETKTDTYGDYDIMPLTGDLEEPEEGGASLAVVE